MEDIAKLLQEVRQTHFWGSIQLDYQDGALVLIRKTETLKPRKENNRDEQQRNSQ